MMGESFWFTWFGKSVTELKAILETDKNLTEEQKVELKKLIDEKEKESK
jgi:hypothetical protein